MTVLGRCTILFVITQIVILVSIPGIVCQSLVSPCTRESLLATEDAKYLTVPRYPYGYTSETRCQWEITADSPSEVVVLTLLDFDVGYSSSCDYNYGTIYDGSISDYLIIEKLCGHVSDGKFTSTNSSMTIVIHSYDWNGIRFVYTSQNKSDVAVKCGRIRRMATENSTYLTSPNYPNNYPSNLDCEWHITTGSSSEVVVLRLWSFNMEQSTSCIYDSVSIYDGSSKNSPIIQTLCGLVSTTQFRSTGPNMTVVFHSDEYINLQGFKFEYTTQSKAALCTNGTLEATHLIQYLTSPDYPNNYTSYLDCKWVMTSYSSSATVVLNLLDFSVTGSPATICDGDYVAIYHGPDSHLKRTQTLCGEISSSEDFHHNDSIITVMFHSDSFFSNRGFKFAYFIQDACPNNVLYATETGKYITSPGYPFNYPSGLNCQWKIFTYSSSQVILLKVLDFELQLIKYLYPDWEGDDASVTIYDGDSASAPLLQTMQGHVSNTHIISKGSYMTVMFNTNRFTTYKGFKLEYTALEKSAAYPGGTLVASSTVHNSLISPNYPNPYPSNKDQQWHITSNSGSGTIVLETFDFEMDGDQSTCASDYVKIYDGANTGFPLVIMLCGRVHYGKFQSTGYDMTVVFHSDGGANYNNGFSFNYWFEKNGPYSDYIPDNNSTTIVIATCSAVASFILFVVFGVCLKKKLAQRRLKKTEIKDSKQNVGDKSMFVIPVLTDNPEKANPPNFGMPEHQSMFDPAPYASLDGSVNDKLPDYTPSEPGHSVNGLPPYSSDLPGGTGHKEPTSQPICTRPEESVVDVESTQDKEAHLNNRFTSSNEVTRDHVTDQNGSADASTSGETSMTIPTVTYSPPSCYDGSNPSCTDNNLAPRADPVY